MSKRFEQIARECLRKKDDRGDLIVLSLDGRKRDRPFKDVDFVEIAKFLPDAVRELVAAREPHPVRGNRLVQLEFHGECNECGDEGAAAVCRALLQLRAENVAAVRAVFLWKNELGDSGAMSVADLLEHSSLPGHERLWIAEVHLSHNKITTRGAQALFRAAERYPRGSHAGAVPLWLRLEHNAIDLDKLDMPPHCRAESRGDRRGGVQRTVHASNCGVSQCCQSPVPALHLHLFENQDKKKVEEVRLAPPPHVLHKPIVMPVSTRSWGGQAAETAQPPPPPTPTADDFPSLPGAARPHGNLQPPCASPAQTGTGQQQQMQQMQQMQGVGVQEESFTIPLRAGGPGLASGLDGPGGLDGLGTGPRGFEQQYQQQFSQFPHMSNLPSMVALEKQQQQQCQQQFSATGQQQQQQQQQFSQFSNVPTMPSFEQLQSPSTQAIMPPPGLAGATPPISHANMHTPSQSPQLATPASFFASADRSPAPPQHQAQEHSPLTPAADFGGGGGGGGGGGCETLPSVHALQGHSSQTVHIGMSSPMQQHHHHMQQRVAGIAASLGAQPVPMQAHATQAAPGDAARDSPRLGLGSFVRDLVPVGSEWLGDGASSSFSCLLEPLQPDGQDLDSLEDAGGGVLLQPGRRCSLEDAGGCERASPPGDPIGWAPMLSNGSRASAGEQSSSKHGDSTLGGGGSVGSVQDESGMGMGLHLSEASRGLQPMGPRPSAVPMSTMKNSNVNVSHGARSQDASRPGGGGGQMGVGKDSASPLALQQLMHGPLGAVGQKGLVPAMPALPMSAMSLSDVEMSLRAGAKAAAGGGAEGGGGKQKKDGKHAKGANGGADTRVDAPGPLRERDMLLKQIPASNVRLEHNKCLVNLDKMGFTDGDVMVLAPLVAAHLCSQIKSRVNSGGKMSIDLSAEENFITDPGVEALCTALDQVVREFKGRVSVRGLNLAYNGVTDHGCLSIAKLVKLHTELALSGFGGGGTGAGGEGKKKKGDKTETSKEESAGEAGVPPMQLRLAWNHITAAGAALLLNAFPPHKGAGGGSGAANGGGAGKKGSDKRLAARAKCLLGYNFVSVEVLHALLNQGAGDDGVAPVDLELGAGPGAGGGGGGAAVQFLEVRAVHQLVWQQGASAYASYASSNGGEGGGGGGAAAAAGRPPPLLVVLSPESLVRLAQRAAGAGKGGAGANAGGSGGGSGDFADLLRQLVGGGGGKGKGGKGSESGAGASVKFVVLGCVYRALRFLHDSALSSPEDQRTLGSLLTTWMAKAIEGGSLCFLDGPPLPEIDLGEASEASTSTPKGDGHRAGPKEAGGDAGGVGGKKKPLSLWKAALVPEVLVSSLRFLHKRCQQVAAQTRAERCGGKTSLVLVLAESPDMTAACKTAGVAAAPASLLLQALKPGRGIDVDLVRQLAQC